jgi:nucleobase transporter 1/2
MVSVALDFSLLLGGRFISPIVIAPVTTIVGLGLLEYGFPGVCTYLRPVLLH